MQEPIEPTAPGEPGQDLFPETSPTTILTQARAEPAQSTREARIEELMRKYTEHPELLRQWQCPYCDHEPFNNHRRRVMHVLAMHQGMPQPRISREEDLARKRLSNARMRLRYKSRGLTTAGKQPTRGVPPSKSPERKHLYYVRHKEKMAAQGLNAHGEPYKAGPRMVKKIRLAQKLRRQRERSEAKAARASRLPLLNGTTGQSDPFEPEKPTDNLAESARAIILAAQVLRSVSVGMKL